MRGGFSRQNIPGQREDNVLDNWFPLNIWIKVHHREVLTYRTW